jgi:hypothetical protein
MTKIAGSGSGSESISLKHGSEDPDPDPDPPQNVMDPEHCMKLSKNFAKLTISLLNWPGNEWNLRSSFQEVCTFAEH